MDQKKSEHAQASVMGPAFFFATPQNQGSDKGRSQRLKQGSSYDAYTATPREGLEEEGSQPTL